MPHMFIMKSMFVLGFLLAVFVAESGASTCPDGSQPVNCFVNPCLVPNCTELLDMGAECETDYCGGCHSLWTLPDGSTRTSCDA